jgi:hypothetical protein
MMDPITATIVLLIMLGFTMLTGYGYVYAFADDFDIEAKIAFSGIFGLSQTLIAFFLCKSFTTVDISVFMVIGLNISTVCFSWFSRKSCAIAIATKPWTSKK